MESAPVDSRMNLHEPVLNWERPARHAGCILHNRVITEVGNPHHPRMFSQDVPSFHNTIVEVVVGAVMGYDADSARIHPQHANSQTNIQNSEIGHFGDAWTVRFFPAAKSIRMKT
jgi:hypothetical protein